MEQFYNLTIELHGGIVYLTLIMAGVNFYILNGQNPKRKYVALLPLYYMFLASLAFTGLVLINFINNILPVVIMGASWIYILVTTIKSYKITKVEPEFTQNSIKKIKTKYLIDMAIYLAFIAYGRF